MLELAVTRLFNKESAARLFTREHTVKNHTKNVLSKSKLHLRSRRQAAAYGVPRGWIRLTDSNIEIRDRKSRDGKGALRLIGESPPGGGTDYPKDACENDQQIAASIQILHAWPSDTARDRRY